VEFIKKKPPKAAFVDFHSLRQFQQAFFLFWSFFFLCENRYAAPEKMSRQDRL